MAAMIRPTFRSTAAKAIAPVRSTPATTAAVSAPEGSTIDLLFFAYLCMLVVEYVGLGNVWPVLKVIRFSTLIAWGLTIVVLSRAGLTEIKTFRQSKLMAIFVFWTAASVAWAIVQSYVPAQARVHLDYLGLLVITMYLVDRPARFKVLAVVFTGVLITIVLRNLDNLSVGTRMVRFRGAYFTGDGNDLAWTFVSLLGFPLFLVLGRVNILLRGLGLAGFGISILAIVSTQSRGGVLALGAAVLYYWAFMAKRKALGVAALLVLCAGVLVIAPEGFVGRMETIGEYEEDASAQGRIRAWKAAIQMGLHYPLGVGAGNFSSAYGRYYRPDNLTGYGANRWISAHSVYFKVLGEYGYGGLTLILVVLVSNILDNQRLLRRIRSDPSASAVPEAWPALLNLTIVGYAAGGMFLGGISYPHLYLFTGLTLGLRRYQERTLPAAVTVDAPVRLSRFGRPAPATAVAVSGRPADAPPSPPAAAPNPRFRPRVRPALPARDPVHGRR
jgi:putative inorganic carbon (hco3(-)) transporter